MQDGGTSSKSATLACTASPWGAACSFSFDHSGMIHPNDRPVSCPILLMVWNNESSHQQSRAGSRMYESHSFLQKLWQTRTLDQLCSHCAQAPWKSRIKCRLECSDICATKAASLAVLHRCSPMWRCLAGSVLQRHWQQLPVQSWE